MQNIPKKIKCEFINDNFQNYKRYNIPKADFIIADIPYNLGINAYASNPLWYKGGDIKNGKDKSKAGKAFFNTDFSFNLAEFFHFSSRLLKKAKGKNKEGVILVFCFFEQQFKLIELAKKKGFKSCINLVFIKDSSPQVLKANMRICGACEYALLLFRDALPNYYNNNRMFLNWFEYKRDKLKKVHPTQKSTIVLKQLIKLFTKPYDTVIGVCAGSGSSLRACKELDRHSFGFEIDKKIYKEARKYILDVPYSKDLFLTF